MSVPVDHNVEKWSAFCPSEEVAEIELKKMIERLSLKKKIISAKKEISGSRRHTFHDLTLYKFTIVTESNDK